MKLIDTHAHIDFPEFDRSRRDVLERAQKNEIAVVNCSLNEQGWAKIAEFKGFKELYLSIGCSPFRLEEFDSQYALVEENMEKIVAVGEIGLDYYWVKEEDKRAKEWENFIAFLKLAKEHDKPVIIHSRNAESHALDILEKERMERVIMHCFSGTLAEAERAIGLGYLVSIPTNIAKSKQKQEFAKKLPLDSLVLETDAPYLSPEPGKTNEPVNIINSVRRIAEINGLDFDEVARVTTKNARGLLRI